MSGNPITENDWTLELAESLLLREPDSSVTDAEATLKGLAGVFLESLFLATQSAGEPTSQTATEEDSTDEPLRVLASRHQGCLRRVE